MASSTTSRRFPTSLNGGELQAPDDVRVGETHHVAREGHQLDSDRAESHPDSTTAVTPATAAPSAAEPRDADGDRGSRGGSGPATERGG